MLPLVQGEANAMLARHSESDKFISEDFVVSAFTPLLLQQSIDELAREIFSLLDYNRRFIIYILHWVVPIYVI